MKKTDFPDAPAFDPEPRARSRTGIPDADAVLKMWLGWAVVDVDVHPDGGHQVTILRNGVRKNIHMVRGREVGREDV
jgi:hypothetical protein